MAEFNTTDIFNKKDFNNAYIKEVLKDVIITIRQKNYDPVNQIMGYIKTENPVFIPRDNGARDKILELHKDEILEYLLYHFIEENKC